ncbi:hypothetical protein ALGA_2362 [Labilibaculum antarcticum]|uniref:Uncharacterized protein n=1 Tax=Labilibaculum antarcticum TaxID=1717717 RepID=A0A1Y1CJX2_9BACT|nr:hypothetical protein ALGA_2362 [Labilibaculum antarcticum]
MAQSIIDTPPIEQHVCSEAEIIYSFFGYEGSTIKRYVDGTELTPPIVLNTPANNVPSSSPVYQKGSFTHTWDATSYPPKSTAYLLQIKEFSANCESDLISLNIYVHRKPSVSATVTPISCNGLTNGKILIGNTTPPFAPPLTPSSNFDVIQEFSLDGSNYTEVSEFSNLGPDNYTLYYRYTYDDNGTTMIVSESSGTITGIEVTEPAVITLTSAGVTSPVNCNGGDATVTLVATGGNGALSYTFAGVTNTSGVFTHAVGTNLSYSITDANSCTAVTGTLNITEPAVISLTSASVTIPVSCKGGDATVTLLASGGSGALTYAFDGVDNTTGVFTHVAGTSLSYSITDANSCTAVTGTLDITEPAVISLTSAGVTSPVSCNGGDATVTLLASGGIGALTYTFDGVSNTTGVFTHAAGTSLSYSITDANSCTAVTGTLDITEPAVISLTSAGVTSPVSCNGGDATVTLLASGGIGALTYTFDGVSNTTGVFTHAAGTSLSYSITDANSCTAVTGTLDITEPAVITLTSAGVTIPVSCNGGDATVTLLASGGIGALTYTFDGVSNTTGVFTHAAGTSLSYSITDANSCTAVTGNLNITEPAVISLTSAAVTIPVSCNGGDATVTLIASGGSGALTYAFDGVDNTTGVFTHAAGTSLSYSITDANSCTAVTGTLNITEPAVISLTSAAVTIPVSCNGGDATVTLIATGGSGALTYTFDGVDNTTGVFTHAAGTNLSYSITDANSCTAVTGTLNIAEPEAVTILLAESSSIICNGSNAQVTITAAGGDGTYTYSNDGSTYQASNLFSLPAGNHTLYVKDGKGCVAFDDIIIVEPTAIITNLVLNASNICFGDAGVITIKGYETDVTYSLFEGASSLVYASSVSGSDLILTIDAIILNTENTYNILIKAERGGCTLDMDTGVSITVEHKPNPSGINF